MGSPVLLTPLSLLQLPPWGFSLAVKYQETTAPILFKLPRGPVKASAPSVLPQARAYP